MPFGNRGIYFKRYFHLSIVIVQRISPLIKPEIEYFQILKLRILEEKIFPISLKLFHFKYFGLDGFMIQTFLQI